MADPKRPRPPVTLDRRDFLIGSAGALGAGLLGGSAALAQAAAEEPQVRHYVPLGRTGMKISDISFGSSRTSDPAVVRRAFERGVNYFDSAEGYKGGASETAIGEALAGVRDRVFITSKTKAGANAKRDQIMRALEGSLRRLRTDHVDVYFNHAVNDVSRMQNTEWAEFTEQAKKQGKIRFRGLSGHAGRLVECLDYSLDNDLVDVILVAYNFGQDPDFFAKATRRFDFVALQPGLPPLLDRAHEKGVGVVAMKTLMGGRINDMRPWERPGGTFAQAAFRWVLSSRAMRPGTVRVTASRAAPAASRAVHTGCPCRRCCAPGCTRSTTETASWRAATMRSSAPGRAPASAATARPARAPVRTASPSPTSPARPPDLWAEASRPASAGLRAARRSRAKCRGPERER